MSFNIPTVRPSSEVFGDWLSRFYEAKLRREQMAQQQNQFNQAFGLQSRAADDTHNAAALNLQAATSQAELRKRMIAELLGGGGNAGGSAMGNTPDSGAPAALSGGGAPAAYSAADVSNSALPMTPEQQAKLAHLYPGASGQVEGSTPDAGANMSAPAGQPGNIQAFVQSLAPEQQAQFLNSLSPEQKLSLMGTNGAAPSPAMMQKSVSPLNSEQYKKDARQATLYEMAGMKVPPDLLARLSAAKEEEVSAAKQQPKDLKTLNESVDDIHELIGNLRTLKDIAETDKGVFHPSAAFLPEHLRNAVLSTVASGGESGGKWDAGLGRIVGAQQKAISGNRPSVAALKFALSTKPSRFESSEHALGKINESLKQASSELEKYGERLERATGIPYVIVKDKSGYPRLMKREEAVRLIQGNR